MISFCSWFPHLGTGDMAAVISQFALFTTYTLPLSYAIAFFNPWVSQDCSMSEHIYCLPHPECKRVNHGTVGMNLCYYTINPTIDLLITKLQWNIVSYPTLLLTDLNSHVLKFTKLFTSPQFLHQKSQLNFVFTVVHLYSILSSFLCTNLFVSFCLLFHPHCPVHCGFMISSFSNVQFVSVPLAPVCMVFIAPSLKSFLWAPLNIFVVVIIVSSVQWNTFFAFVGFMNEVWGSRLRMISIGEFLLSYIRFLYLV